jgi:crooked neck
MPENVWKAYIDFEISLGEYDRVRKLYEQLLSRSKHLKVWISYGKFEQDSARDAQRARKVYEQAYNYFKVSEPELKEERLMILEHWLQLENSEIGDADQLEMVKGKLPKRIKKRRKIKVVNEETGEELNEDAGWEEYYDYVFPDD